MTGVNTQLGVCYRGRSVVVTTGTFLQALMHTGETQTPGGRAGEGTTAGISGEIVRDMMLTAVEQRFAGYRATHRVEYLTDNGSCYTAAETIDFALALGLTPRFTPGSQSAVQRNGRGVLQDVQA